MASQNIQATQRSIYRTNHMQNRERTYMELITCIRVKGAKMIARIGEEPITPRRSFECSTRRMEIAIARVEVVNEMLRSRIS